MRTLAISFLTGLVLAAVGSAQDAKPIHIQAQLDTPVKLAKAKVGDKLKAQVVAQVALKDGIVIPAGSTVMGSVTQVDADSVTLVFDKADVDGKKIPLDITLVAAAQLGGPKQMTEGGTTSGSPTSDRPLSATGSMQPGSNAGKGVSVPSSSSAATNTPAGDTIVKQGGVVHATPGSVIGMPGVALAVDDGAPYASKFTLGSGKDKQLPKGLQLMFTVR